MIGETDGLRACVSAVSPRAPAVLLVASLFPLLMIACGATTPPESPTNQRYWHDVSQFVVLHWDASAHADSYIIYYGDCPEEGPCDVLGETRSTSAAAYIGEHLYRDDCSPQSPCTSSPHGDDRPSTNAADFVHEIYIVACNSSGCSERETANPAQRLLSPDGPAPSTPTGFKGEKIVRSEAPDGASVTWNPVDGATYYELWVGSVPSSEFRLGVEIQSHGVTFELEPVHPELRPWDRFSLPINRGAFGEYSTTSWKVRACNKAGCSPFSYIVTVE